MSFTADMNKFCKTEAPDYLDRVVRKTVIEIGNRLVYRSPVGDASYWQSSPPAGYVGGRFRGNWQYSFGAMPRGFTDAIDKSGASTLSAIVSSALSGNAVGVHYLSNNLPYAQRIEDGWSRQAPQGIVGRVELEFASIVRQAKAS